MLGGISFIAETQAQRDQRRYYEQRLMQQQYNALQQMAGVGDALGGLQGFGNAQRQQSAYRPPEKAAPKSIAVELQESVDKWLADVKI